MSTVFWIGCSFVGCGVVGLALLGICMAKSSAKQDEMAREVFIQ